MRLYLSSFKLGNRPERLVALARSGRRASLVLNALDNRPETRARFLAGETQALTALGFAVTELDLRQCFDAPDRLRAALDRTDVLWINGGNAFLLRRAMQRSGFDRLIHDYLASDRLVYAGFSAAVCCAAPTLRGADYVDDAHDVCPPYDAAIVWEGLGLIPHNVAVHYKSDHPESADVEKEVQYYRDNGIPFTTLSDGQALVVDGAETEIAQ